MNLRKYYDKVQAIRRDLSGPDVYLTSLATPNGGKEGCVAEVPVDLAARMIVDGIARLAEAEEIAAYLSVAEELRAAAQEEHLRNRLRITLVNDSDVQLASERTSAKSKSRN